MAGPARETHLFCRSLPDKRSGIQKKCAGARTVIIHETTSCTLLPVWLKGDRARRPRKEPFDELSCEIRAWEDQRDRDPLCPFAGGRDPDARRVDCAS